MHFWRGKGGTGIHLAADKFLILVRKDPKKKSGHPKLWEELDKRLKQEEL